MVALRFYATGSFQLVNADVHNISKSSVSNITRDVTQCLVRVCQQYVVMPTDPVELQSVMQGFYNVANFPNVVGAIDGTHIRIRAPSVDEHIYVNRKNYHSVNVQGVCDSDMKFMNIVAKWPGATHDAFIWANSNISEMFENRTIGHGWLLGDSGYPLRPWLLTPVLNPGTRQQQRYNEAHMQTRSMVERSFGLLKSRFRCIDTSGGTLLYTPKRCCDIVIAVVVLHNMCIIHRIPLPADNFEDRGRLGRQHYNGNLNDGAAVRQRLINGRF
ncbi:HARBI1 [Mytilus edulis]|uniref:Putative nuclease HARBI1 n=1 Tax=Mytilus edulis TaxID=6550 RepID=A0A8S3TFG7_MYTED|nr:HARBI1 [Mytilus edulis]